MTSEVDICNLALAHLGDSATVVSIDPPEGSAQAEHCATFYPISRDQILATHAWSFATKRVTLASVSENSTVYNFAYAIPNDYIKALTVLFPDSFDDTQSQPFTIETDSSGLRRLYTNVEGAVLRYIWRQTDTTRYTPGFVVALARLLASNLAGPIIKGTEGMKVPQAHLTVYLKEELPVAKARDANAQQTDQFRNYRPSWISNR